MLCQIHRIAKLRVRVKRSDCRAVTLAGLAPVTSFCAAQRRPEAFLVAQRAHMA
jgi:hypothetical protein